MNHGINPSYGLRGPGVPGFPYPPAHVRSYHHGRRDNKPPRHSTTSLPQAPIPWGPSNSTMWREPVYSKEYLENAPKTSQGTPFGSVLFHDPPPAEYCAPPPQPGMNLEEFFPATESPELADSDYLSEEMANDPSRSNASVDHRYESPGNIDHSMGTHHVQGLTPAQYSSSHKNGYDQTFTERHTYPPTIVPHGQYHHERHAGAYPNQQAIEHLPRPPLSGPNAAGQSGRWYWIPDDAASTQIQKPGVFAGERERLPVAYNGPTFSIFNGRVIPDC